MKLAFRPRPNRGLTKLTSVSVLFEPHAVEFGDALVNFAFEVVEVCGERGRFILCHAEDSR